MGSALLAFVSIGGSGAAQDLPTDKAHWKLFQEEQPLADLIDACAALIGQSILYNPAEITGSVRLRMTAGVSADQLWDLANEALVSRGFTTVQVAGSDALQVVAIGNAPAPARVEDFSTRLTNAGFTKVLYRPEREKADVIAEGIKLVLSKSGM